MKGKKSIINLDQYLLLVGLVSLVTGLLLFVYCVLGQVSILRVGVMGNPLFYLILGLGLLATRFFFMIDEVISNE
jgi:hypothetical protein